MSADKLVKMANQIGKFLQPSPTTCRNSGIRACVPLLSPRWQPAARASMVRCEKLSAA